MLSVTPNVTVGATDPSGNPANQQVLAGGAYDGVVQIFTDSVRGSGVLLESGRHILTAAHVIDDATAGELDIYFDLPGGAVRYEDEAITLHPAYDGFGPYDLAIITLDSPAPIDGYELFTGDPIGETFTLVGYGALGTGDLGTISGNPNNQKWFATNVYDIYGGDVYSTVGLEDGPLEGTLIYDFDDGTAGTDASDIYFGVDTGVTPFEGNSAPGDSGGATFINGQIAGIVSGGIGGLPSDVSLGVNSSFGELSFDSNVAFYADWITSVIDPLPTDTGPADGGAGTPSLGGPGNGNTEPGSGPQVFDQVVQGTATADFIIATPGTSALLAAAGPGADTVFGSAGGDLIYGNQGRDLLISGNDADTVFGGQDEDFIAGDSGADILYGNIGEDTLTGDADNDVLFGGQGADLIDAGLGNDTLFGNRGNDTLSGGDGADDFVFNFSSDQWDNTISDFNAAEGDRLIVSGVSAVGLGVFEDGDGNLILRSSVELDRLAFDPVSFSLDTVGAGYNSVTLVGGEDAPLSSWLILMS